MMVHFLKGGNWQDGVGVDFLGEVKYKEQQNQPLMEEDVDGLSDRQIEIILGRTGWTGNNFDFFRAGSALRQRRVVDMVKNRKIFRF